LAWDPRVADTGVRQLQDAFSQGSNMDDVLSSYVLSLAVAIFLRRRTPGRVRSLEMLQFAPDPDQEILLVNDFLPKAMSEVQLDSCSFPRITLEIPELTDITIQECDFRSLSLAGSPRMKLTRCTVRNSEIKELKLSGHLVFEKSELDLDASLADR